MSDAPSDAARQVLVARRLLAEGLGTGVLVTARGRGAG